MWPKVCDYINQNFQLSQASISRYILIISSFPFIQWFLPICLWSCFSMLLIQLVDCGRETELIPVWMMTLELINVDLLQTSQSIAAHCGAPHIESMGKLVITFLIVKIRLQSLAPLHVYSLLLAVITSTDKSQHQKRCNTFHLKLFL